MSQPRRGSFIDHIASKLEPWITQNEPTPPQPPAGDSQGNAERTFSFQDGEGKVYDARWVPNRDGSGTWEWQEAGGGQRWSRVTHNEDLQRMNQMFEQYQQQRPGASAAPGGQQAMGAAGAPTEAQPQRQQSGGGQTILGGATPDQPLSDEERRRREEEARRRNTQRADEFRRQPW